MRIPVGPPVRTQSGGGGTTIKNQRRRRMPLIIGCVLRQIRFCFLGKNRVQKKIKDKYLSLYLFLGGGVRDINKILMGFLKVKFNQEF